MSETLMRDSARSAGPRADAASTNDKTYYVGLTMAGAISAGAYSAGAFDFLMEALDEWEEAKATQRKANVLENQWPVPCHDIIIPVMSGASAGGITGALGLIALSDQAPPPPPYQYPQVGRVTTRLDRLYKAWVLMPRFVSPVGASELLGTKDLTSSQPIQDQVLPDPPPILSSSTARCSTTSSRNRSSNFTTPPKKRAYLSETIHLFLTHANMRGVPFEVGFIGGTTNQPGYGMMLHADRRHFTVTGIGTATFSSKWADPDPAQAIDMATPPNLASLQENWKDYAFSTLGTSAFPVGLRARVISPTTIEYYTHRQWTLPSMRGDSVNGKKLFRLPTKYPLNVGPRVDYVTIDGGMLNNEPFELARWTLMKDPPTRNARGFEDNDRATIMIDPFPENPDFDVTLSLDANLGAVIRRLLPIFKDQARFKPDDLVAALDEKVFSRFLIAPRRRVTATADLERFGIACGLLGGFGGFLSEEFRAHDYQLGRFNAYWFLRESFSAPLTNKVLVNGYATPNARFDAFKTTPVNGHGLLPDHSARRHGRAMPTPPVWPRVSKKRSICSSIARKDASVPSSTLCSSRRYVSDCSDCWCACVDLFGAWPVTNGIRWV